jgi:prepilin-type N-terminal cleavage/methylation domain-containing protein
MACHSGLHGGKRLDIAHDSRLGKESVVRRRRHGFTLLELLTVIGVMLVLMGIAIIGYTHVSKATATKSTRVDLDNAKNLLAEYENTTPITGLPFSAAPSQIVDSRNHAVNVADVTPDFGNPPMGNNDRYGGAVQYTIEIMTQLVRFPQNKQTISQLPAKRLLAFVDGTALRITQPVSGIVLPKPPQAQYCLLDSWNNPIIYVPATGLNVLIRNGPSTQSPSGEPRPFVVRSSGIYPAGQVPPLGAKDRPFWASAGPDGNFQNGDDNMYSFED